MAFARLLDKYSQGCCYNYGGCFTTVTNAIWVGYKDHQNKNTLIIPSKLGNISTENFFNGLLNIFSFMMDETLTFSSEDKARILSKKNQLLTIKNVSELTHRHYALALLEEAWNELISFTDADFKKFEYLFGKTSETDPTYLISYTNELNFHKILTTLKARYPDIDWETDVDLTTKPGVDVMEPIKIAPGLYVQLSYIIHSAKTPDMLENLVSTLNADKRTIEVVSQFKGDRDAATTIAINEANIHTAENYYAPVLAEQHVHAS